jgi:hypothetical protein
MRDTPVPPVLPQPVFTVPIGTVTKLKPKKVQRQKQVPTSALNTAATAIEITDTPSVPLTLSLVLRLSNQTQPQLPQKLT